VQISLDADDEQTYARQRPGASLARVHAACRAVRDAGLPLEVTFAPTRLNIDQAGAVIARARALGAFRFNTGALMPIGRAARLWQRLVPSAEQYAGFRERLAQERHVVDGEMEICHDPFTVQAGLQQSLDTPPATILILPNGWVKVVAAIGYVCGDLRRMTLTEAWEQYRAAWHNDTVISAIRQSISADLSLAAANTWTPIPNGVM